MKTFLSYITEKQCGDHTCGLWDNIRKRRASGKRMRKPGEKGAPTAAAIKASQNESTELSEVDRGDFDWHQWLKSKPKKPGHYIYHNDEPIHKEPLHPDKAIALVSKMKGAKPHLYNNLNIRRIREDSDKESHHTHAAHFENEKGEWTGMALINAKNDDDAIAQAHKISADDKWKNFKLASVERHIPVKEEIEQIDERGADSKGYFRSTESGAGLTPKGAKHFGIHTAVTAPPSKLKKGGKAWNRRKSFCARMSGMKGPMKDEKGRPTRKAMSLRRWNCHEETED